MHFAIVTPVLNGARFIDETIASVVTQAGPFAIRYHVQDGGSTDGTLEKLERWQARLAGDFPVLGAGVKFTYHSGPDSGLYDAVNHGFAICGDVDVMAWINADDRFQPGAFATVAQLFDRFGDIEWLTGRTNMIDETGTPLGYGGLVPFPREAIAAGVFDNRASPRCIQQEGTFWRSALWRRAGGADARFRLAGDFDLWRRFAGYADLVVVDAMLGSFRKRDGQATSDLSRYYAEIDRLVPMQEDDRRILAHRMKRGRLPYRLIWRPGAGDWTCHHHRPIHGLWALRRHLPRTFSIRARLGITNTPTR